MNSKIMQLFKSWNQTFLEIFFRFPEAILFAFTTCVTLLVYQNNIDNYSENTENLLFRLAMTFALGFFLGIIHTLAVERFFAGQVQFPISGLPLTKRSLFSIAFWVTSLVILFSFFFWLLGPLEFKHVTRYFGVVLSAILLCFATPFLFRRHGIVRFSETVLIRLAFTGLFSFIIQLGLIAIVASVDFLFNTEWLELLAPQIFILMLCVFAPLFLLKGVPSGTAHELTDPTEMIVPLRVLIFSILMPLTSIYAFVLSVYAVQIIATQNWPNGVVGNLVLWFSIICSIIFYFANSRRETNRWVSLYMSIMPKWLLPLLAMLFVAVWLRIDAYGWTENRYFLVAVAIWSTLTCLYYGFQRTIYAALVPFALLVTIIISISGPWSSYAVSLNHQTSILKDILTKYNLIQDGKMIEAKNNAFTNLEKEQIRSVIDYISEFHTMNDLSFLPENIRESEESFKKWFGFELYQTMDVMPDGAVGFYHQALMNAEDDREPGIDIRGFDHMFTSESMQSNKPLFIEKNQIQYNPETFQLKIIYADGKEDLIDVARVAADAHRKTPDRESWTSQEMVYDDNKTRIPMRFIFRYMSGSTKNDHQDVKIQSLDFWLFVKSTEEKSK